MTVLQFTLFGSPQVALDQRLVTGFSTQKAQALLYYLVATKRLHTRDLLADLLWTNASSNRARNNLSYTLTNLRKLVGTHLQISRATIGFDLESDYTLDVDELQAILKKDLQETTKDDQEKIATFYRGEFLRGFHVRNAEPFEEWLLQEREKQKTDVVDRLNGLADVHLVAADYGAGVSAARKLLEIEPWHEEAQCKLMLCLAGEGQTAPAIASYRTYSERLQREFDVEPGQESRAVFESLRTMRLASGLAEWQGAALRKLFGHEQVQSSDGASNDPLHVVRQSSTTSNTFQQLPSNNLGMPSYSDEQLVLFGREQERVKGLSWLQAVDKRILLLDGPSGVGKTEVARAIAHDAAAEIGQSSSDAEEPFIGAFDGIYFVDAKPIFSPSPETAAQPLYTLFDAIADVLQIEKGSAETVEEALFAFLRPHSILLVLDALDNWGLRLNAKGNGLADQLGRLLKEAPNARLIATTDTSRIASNADGQESSPPDLAGELSASQHLSRIVLAPLDVSTIRAQNAMGFATDEPLAHANPAIELFRASVTSRANSSIKTAPKMRQADLHQMTSICRLVHGLPLAIKLAAGLLKYMRLHEVFVHLEELSVEQTGIGAQIGPEDPTRIYSLLLTVVDNCLNSHEQRIMMRLSICSGSFSERAAREIGLASQATLKQLVDTALLQQTEQIRYQLHENVRHFFYAKLTRSQPFFREAHQRFCSYFAVWLERLMETMEEAASGDFQSAFLPERKNIVHAFELSKKLNHASAAQRLAKFMDR